MIPQSSESKTALIEHDKKEKTILKSAKNKLDKIGSDHVNSVGLTKDEIGIAVKADLIDADEAWWYIEEWQEGEREATRDEAEGRTHRTI